MAKGVEDCAFYRWSRLTSLNEVGGDPSVFAVDPVAFHDAMATRQAERPHAMTAASTHDTKRAEDVRARIAVLAEVPDVWERALDRLLELAPLPDPRLRQPAVAGRRRRLVRRPGAARPAPRVRREGDARGRRPHHLDRSRRGVRAGRPRRGRRRLRRRAGPRRARRGAAGRRRRRSEQRAVGQAARPHHPGCPGRLPGLRAARGQPGRPRQPSAGRLRDPRPDGRRGATRPPQAAAGPRGAPAPTRPSRALHVVRPRARRRARRPTTSLAFDRGGAVTVVTRLPHGLAARGGWGDTTLALPAGRWRDLLTERVVTSDGSVAVAELLATGCRSRCSRRCPSSRAGADRSRSGHHTPERVRLVVDGDGDGIVDMMRGAGRLVAPRRRAAAPGARGRLPLRLPRRRPPGPRARPPLTPSARRPSTARSRTFDVDAFAVVRRHLARPAARRRDHLRAAPRDVHPRRHARRRDRAARPPRRDRRRVRRADARQRLQRRARLGLRRRPVVRGPRAVRRPGGLPALRRRLPRPGPRRHPGRRAQPPRPVGQLPADVRPLPGRGRHPLGRPGQPRPGRLPRGAAADPGLGPRLVHRLPRRRAPARCRPRARRPVRAAPARGDGHRGRRDRGPPRQAAVPGGGVRPQRPPRDHPPRVRRPRASTPSGATTSTTPSTSR